MRKKRSITITTAVFTVGIATAACGNGPSSSSDSISGLNGASGFNSALTSIVNPSSSTTGTLRLEDSAAFDFLDPGRTYDEATEDLYRLFDRTVMTYKHAPGAAGLQVEGDLATSEKSSNDDKTWTYTIVPDAKFSNGDTITTHDIAYAIERSNFDATGAISGGPTYFANLLQNNNNYQGPYKDPNGQVSGISTPNATTITFNLVKPFADFNYLMTLLDTSPIEPNHDAAANYDDDISKDLFTGQYTVASYKPGVLLDLTPNPEFDAASDPDGVHKRNASAVDVNLSVNAETADQNLLSGASNLDVHGAGVSSATESIVLGDPVDRADADSIEDGFETFMSVNTQVKPFDNLDCRQAIEWAVDKREVQNVSGGPDGGGQIATTVLPQMETGYEASDRYATGNEQGNATQAKSLFDSCRQAEGSSFDPSFTLATYDTQSNPKMIAAAQVIQQNLESIGFDVTIQQYNYNTAFFPSTAGLPSFAEGHRIGLSLWAWDADFPTGYGFMDEILTKDGISSSGNSYDLSYWDSPTFDSLMDEALSSTSPAKTDEYYADADQYAMSQAVIVPLLDQSVLLYRPASTTNVTVSLAYGMYDYTMLGTTNSSN